MSSALRDGEKRFAGMERFIEGRMHVFRGPFREQSGFGNVTEFDQDINEQDSAKGRFIVSFEFFTEIDGSVDFSCADQDDVNGPERTRMRGCNFGCLDPFDNGIFIKRERCG